MAEIKVEANFVCDTCGDILDSEQDWNGDIKIAFCSRCKDDIEKDAHDAGYNEAEQELTEEK